MASLAPLPLHRNPSVAFAVEPIAVDPIARVFTGDSKKEERVPLWGYGETNNFIAIRSDLEQDFTQAKRNKSLWEIIALKMRDRGYARSADQCKCKWKNLSNRYKALAVSQTTETTDMEKARACPFYRELCTFFAGRNKRPAGPGKRNGRKRLFGERSSEDLSEEDEDGDEEDSEDYPVTKRSRKGRKTAAAERCRANKMQEVLEEFFEQQKRVEREWMEALERREEERRQREQEWRYAMEKLEKDRIDREREWREREEQRRMRAEALAHSRDALFSALLASLANPH